MLALSQQIPAIYRESLPEASQKFAVELAYAQVNTDDEIQAVIDGFAMAGAGGGWSCRPSSAPQAAGDRSSPWRHSTGRR